MRSMHIMPSLALTLPPSRLLPPAGQSEGLEFLATRPPWKCSVCNVTCTSQDALMGHAAGAKHKRRVSSSALLGPVCSWVACMLWVGM